MEVILALARLGKAWPGSCLSHFPKRAFGDLPKLPTSPLMQEFQCEQGIAVASISTADPEWKSKCEALARKRERFELRDLNTFRDRLQAARLAAKHNLHVAKVGSTVTFTPQECMS